MRPTRRRPVANPRRTLFDPLLALLLLGIASAPVRAAEAEVHRLAALLADRSGTAVERLADPRISHEILLDGRRLTILKAFDLDRGVPVGAVFEGEREVNRAAEIRRAGERWRAEHGAITPALVRRLEQIAPEEWTPVVAWLNVDLSALPEGKESERPGVRERGSAAGATEAASIAHPTIAAAPASATPKPDIALRPALEPAEERRRLDVQAAMAASDRSRRESVRGAIAAARDRFLDDALLLDLELEYASEISPIVVFHARPDLVEALARWQTIDALDDASRISGPSLSVARPTQNMIEVNDLGYDGSGISVSITEGERAYFANPYLDLEGCYDCLQPYAPHPTAVAGIVRSSHSEEHGLADDVTLYSANGSYASYAVQSAAMDWGSTSARVLNNSWYGDDPNSATFWEADRHQDYFVRSFFDTVIVAAGNFGNGCGLNFSSYVVSPAKAHNILAVGNYDDKDTVGWSDDAMDPCSSFGNPLNSAGTASQEKPEIAAVGAGIWSTTTSDPWVADSGSGTSYASPMVAALAAAVMEAAPTIENDPEAVKALLMATALHNIEGATRLSDKDGAGGIVGAAAIVSAERGHWASQLVGSGTTFPIEFEQFAYAGERVRFVIAWSANPNASYTVDPLPADIDLCAYRADGTTAIQCSASAANAYEIVDFTAPASEVYRFRVTLFDSDWSSGSTWLGAGWWRGEYRISPDLGYDDTHPPATGTHLVVHPTDWSTTIYWRAFGVRPHGTSDYDLQLASHSLFEDPSLRVVEAMSFYGSGQTDFVVVDGNHRSASVPEHYRVLRYAGSEGYDLSFSNLGSGAGNPDDAVSLGPVDMGEGETVKVFDLWIPAASHRRVRVVPTAGSADLALFLFKSDPAVAESHVQGRDQAIASRDRSASGSATERCGVSNPTDASDWLGLVVVNRQGSSVSFRVDVLPSSVFSDDFEGSDTLEWSSSAG